MDTVMDETAHLVPHLERVLRRIESLETPVAQVWGWPGSGKSALLRAFLERQGRRAVGLPLASFAGEAELAVAIESARAAGARWLVAAGGGLDRIAEAALRIDPGQTLLFAGERRWTAPGGLAMSFVPPQELRLGPGEVATLWYLLTGDTPAPDASRRLSEVADGWYRPLRLALESTGGLGLEGVDAEALLELAPVRFFLRHEVLDTFSEEERDLLIAEPESGDGWRLIQSCGLWVEGGDRDRLPALLAAFLERERLRRQPAGHPASTASGERAIRHEPREAPPAPAPDAPSPTYILGLLGSPIARLRQPDGQEVDLDCRLRRSFQVLAYLASSPGLEANREELIEAVWPTEGERTIERNFHPTLSHLRRALEAGQRGGEVSPLLFRKGVYRLNPEIHWEIDALELVRRADEGKARLARGEIGPAAEVWKSAWSLYRGSFLQGHYEGWVAERRERYQRLYLEMLRDVGDLYLKLARPDDAMDAYRTVLLEDPLNERVHVAVMRLYASQGRRDLVRRQYDRLCKLLHEELGVEPMPETTREYHHLMET